MQVCIDAESDSLPCKDNMVIMSYDLWPHNIAHLSWHLHIFGGGGNNLKFLLIMCKNMHFVSNVPFTRLNNHKKT